MRVLDDLHIISAASWGLNCFWLSHCQIWSKYYRGCNFHFCYCPVNFSF